METAENEDTQLTSITELLDVIVEDTEVAPLLK
jgi:hypothetical protein